ncbi:MAG: type II toxin-antitoxin system RelE/ParE family toxin [Arenimonas sp.]|nr:type II toxin-antitoxin system RelE/ParE family toxin [Arenimonas sp.]MBP7981835.1 type II toxin-antitoxin system RelE/ParE family toxin [Arenimonas sp.]
MNGKRIVPRQRANRDVLDAIDHYLNEGANQAALGFINALEHAYAHIGRHPGAGSSRYSYELDLPDLRSWPLVHYPHRVFYIEHKNHIDVWRVLHGQRDIPAWLNTDMDSDSTN